MTKKTLAMFGTLALMLVSGLALASTFRPAEPPQVAMRAESAHLVVPTPKIEFDPVVLPDVVIVAQRTRRTAPSCKGGIPIRLGEDRELEQGQGKVHAWEIGCVPTRN